MFFTSKPSGAIYTGLPVDFLFQLDRDPAGDYEFQIVDSSGNVIPLNGNNNSIIAKMTKATNVEFTVIYPSSGTYTIEYRQLPAAGTPPAFGNLATVPVIDPAVTRVALVPAGAPGSPQQDLWSFIDDVANNLRFGQFANYIAPSPPTPPTPPLSWTAPQGIFASGYGNVTYQSLHGLSTDFVTQSALGNVPAGSAWVPGPLTVAGLGRSYVPTRRAGLAQPFPYDPPVQSDYPLGLVPFVELIFVYWMEEAMLFQALNHIVARFQNRRVADGSDPLARFSVNPLMPLRGILWGLAEAERERLSVRRRSAEYQYEYGLQLIGRAVPAVETLVERRTQFLEAFHSLLHATHRFYKERDDKTVEADPFPLLSSLQELHLVLARGAHNQFADLPLTARIETMDVQWMLAQPEMREFLGGPTMIPYEEPWMDRVDTMKTVQGWSDVSVTHFYDLAFHGEQLLLSVRHGRWNESTRTRFDAENWAMHWKNSIQRYIHAYRVVTGVDLSERADATMPSRLLARRVTQNLARS